MKSLTLLFFTLFFTSGCVSLKSVSLSSIPKNRSNPIEAEVSRFVFLGLSFENNFVNELTDDLKNQCQGGVISGVLTKHETKFWLIGHTDRVVANAYCDKSSMAQFIQTSTKLSLQKLSSQPKSLVE